jgi:type IV pilus assembly protein PilE
MKKGFTLLELIVVIIILGVLATLGFQQYAAVIERSRGAEARAVFGAIRTLAIGFRLQNGVITAFTNAEAGIGAAADQIPSACVGTNYFSYTVTSTVDPTLTLTATRCLGAAGKQPGRQGAGPFTLTLTSNLTAGTDTWGGTGGY